MLIELGKISEIKKITETSKIRKLDRLRATGPDMANSLSLSSCIGYQQEGRTGGEE
jgi:hypothetical protein